MEAANRLQRLFSYDIWANKQIADCLQNHNSFSHSEKSITFYAHIPASQESWYQRLEPEYQPAEKITLWPNYKLLEARQKLETLSQKWQSLIADNQANLDTVISYQNSKEITYNTMLSDILHHLVIHGQHHRAQIAALLRDDNITPPATDFITFVRL